MDERERSGGGGNRWPRQETVALLKIRSDMDVAFRDSNLKGPLWEEVSRKMAELGFQRSAKKCKEKFENVFKYHKRTKDGRQSKPDSKSYRFFDQLEALAPPPYPTPPPSSTATTMTVAQPIAATNLPSHVNVTSTTSTPTPLRVLVSPNMATAAQITNNPINTPSFQQTIHMPPPPSTNTQNPPPIQSNLASSSTSSDEDIQRRRGKKRKWKDYFQRLLNEVIQKQEEMQKKLLDTLEKRDRDRMAREEAWRVQEMARMNREHELLVNERSVAAAKDAAVIVFLQKATEQYDLQIPITKNAQSSIVTNHVQSRVENPQQPPEKPQPPPPPQQSNFQPAAPPPPTMAATPIKMMVDATKTDNGGDSLTATSSSRWPKAEIEALIKLRTDLELKYQDNGPKGPLWEEISLGMGRLGYSRSSKRCKQKWENINKYYKKVKESSKKRPQDSKTCPYVHQLDALYKERAKNDVASSFNFSNPMAPIMAQPEQQWPLAPQQPPDSVIHDRSHNDSDNHEEDDEGYEDEEEDEGAGRYEIVTNKQQISGTN